MVLFQKHWSWENNAPLTFQAFHNFIFGQKGRYKYIICTDSYSNCEDVDLSKFLSLKTLHPSKHPCTLLLLTNVAEVKWINVNCLQKMLNQILCKMNSQKHKTNYTMNSRFYRTCSRWHITYKDRCLLFIWYEVTSKQINIMCSSVNGIPLSLAQMRNLKFVFSAISSAFPAILITSRYNSDQVIKFSYEKYVGTYKTFIESISVTKARGFHICSVSKEISFNGSLGYHCKNEGMILFIYLCDGIFDCPNDQSDEESCSCDILYPIIKIDQIPCKKYLFMHNKLKGLVKQNIVSCNFNVKVTNIIYQVI